MTIMSASNSGCLVHIPMVQHCTIDQNCWKSDRKSLAAASRTLSGLIISLSFAEGLTFLSEENYAVRVAEKYCLGELQFDDGCEQIRFVALGEVLFVLKYSLFISVL